ncbi:MAG: YidC/Oxa1 family insertase periplasmic-domain containing protein, partial [Planctomycetota bacterium]|nr:YidC/Oxa1 family insertase periplasmic-domain containing protein [Planctomycetota bacterium]
LDLSDLDRRPWNVLEREGDKIGFQIATRDGRLIVTKWVTLPAGDEHHFLIQLDFQNASTEDVKFHYLLRGAAGIVQEDVGYGSEPVGLIATTEEDDLSEVAIGKVPKGEPRIDSREIAFTGIQNKYFSMLLVPIQPPGPVFASIASLEQSELLRPYEDKWQFMLPDQEQKLKQQARNNLAASLGVQEVRLEQGAKVTHTYLFFAGPKDKELLESYAAAPEGLEGYSNPHFERILHRGWVGGISRFFVAVLTWIHLHIIANWGVSVIILTFLVRACLHPLNRKSQKSLHGMSKLKPEMDAIKKKYEGRKSKEQSAKMQREILGLYREHHVNPAGGCLPMFVQLPIFFGLYRAFGQAVDLRQADFMLWINDLSREDCLVELSFTIPLIGSRCFNVLPILVILTWFIQQKMQPKAADPQMAQQQKIMSYMLIFMGFFFYKIPSGLNLYFLTSGILGMFENRWIKKQLEALPEPVKKASPSKKKGKKNRRP